MKTDLTTAIIVTIVGVLAAYFLTANVFLSAPKPFSVKTLGTSVSTSLSDPDPEIFNYRALNPTVEVYVGCEHYDATGTICLDEAEESE